MFPLRRTPPNLTRRCRHHLTAAAMTLASILLLGMAASPSFAATAKVLGTGPGLAIQGNIGAGPLQSYGFAGIIHVSIDNGPQTDSYCVDLLSHITVGDVVPQIPPNYPCEVVYILNNTYPHTNTIGTALADTNHEAAAIQAAIWHFTDNFTVSAPGDVVTRAGSIVTAAQSQCSVVPAVPQTITISPASATNYLDGHGGGDTTHSVTATLTDSHGAVVPSYPIKIVITGPAGPQTFNGTTDGSGQFTVNYTNTNGVPGNDTITATATFMVPVGLEFKDATHQGLVMVGMPQVGTVTGTASKSWVVATCGDGVVQPGEQCDDGNGVDGDGCDHNCTTTGCGNGVLTAGEQCDDGNPTNGDGCDDNCTPTGCGNGIVTAGEECDDGNLVDGDGCDGNCTNPRCGNQVIDAGETCDDGNLVDGDGCDHNCTPTGCGNGVVTAGEQCDDGNLIDGDGCDSNCTLPGCGNGILNPGEECDDGNIIDGDGCEANCTLPRCGNGILDSGEECDDGNSSNNDDCLNTCKLATCGDGFLHNEGMPPFEACDDGNLVNGDGCSSTCQPDEICNDLIDNDGNGLIDCNDPTCEQTCQSFFKDPAFIKLRSSHPDKLYVAGGVIPKATHDFAHEEVSFLLTNANGVVYEAVLQPGDLVAKAGVNRNRVFAFLDKTAKNGAGLRNGIYKVKVFKKPNDCIEHVKLFAFNDLNAAILPTMTYQVRIGSEIFFTKGIWIPTNTGWKYNLTPAPPGSKRCPGS